MNNNKKQDSMKTVKVINRILGATFLTLVLLLSGCSNATKNTETSQTEEAVIIQVETVQRAEVEQNITYTATVEADAVNHIAPQSAARIKQVLAEVGDRVYAGQEVARMDRAGLQQANLQMENDKLEFERADELYKIGGLSKADWDAKKLTYELSATSYENLRENTSLVSPISGIVTARNYDSGDMYSGGDPIFVVERIRPVKLLINVSEGLYTRVSKGMEVDVRLDVFGEEIVPGKVKLVYPSIDPKTRTFQVEVELPNANERVRPGMFARATFKFGTEERLVVPDRAIQKLSGSADRFVYVIEGNTAQFRKIELGNRTGDKYEVLEGLNENDRVAVTGQSRLNTGTKVEIVQQ